MKRGASPRPTPLQIIVHLGAWFPLAHLLVDLINDNLTANPIQAMEQRMGLAAITLLMLSLACTPMSSLFGWREPIKRRRALGLYAFMYATIHVIIFMDLDYGLAYRVMASLAYPKIKEITDKAQAAAREAMPAKEFEATLSEAGTDSDTWRYFI